MKIDEAAKKIIDETNRVCAKVDDNNSLIIASSNRLYEDWFLMFPAKATSWNPILEVWNNLDHVTAQDLARVMGVIQRLLDTPVNERFPEKKYRLRWIDDDQGRVNYLNIDDCGVWGFNAMGLGPTEFTESALEQLKRDNPCLATAIDAMKEEVKGDE